MLEELRELKRRQHEEHRLNRDRIEKLEAIVKDLRDTVLQLDEDLTRLRAMSWRVKQSMANETSLTLRQQRCLFTRLLGELTVWAFANGYELALSEVRRRPETAAANAASGKGIANSLHLDGLAADFDLYINGVYQSDSLAHTPLGEKWKSMHPLNRWGGDFRDRNGNPKPDGNHYSSERGGVK